MSRPIPIIINIDRLNDVCLQNVEKSIRLISPQNEVKLISSEKLIVYSECLRVKQKIRNYLDDQKIPYDTFPDDHHERPIKYVLKGLDHVNYIDITAPLVQNGLIPSNISILKTDVSTSRSINYLVSFPPQTDVKKILGVRSIEMKPVKWERFIEREGVAFQCHNCQKFDHNTFECRSGPKCVKCAGDHCTRDCLKSKHVRATCINCGGSHRADNAIRCTVYQRHLALQKENNDHATTELDKGTSTRRSTESDSSSSSCETKGSQGKTVAKDPLNISDYQNVHLFISVLKEFEECRKFCHFDEMISWITLVKKLESWLTKLEECTDKTSKLKVLLDFMVETEKESKLNST